MGRKSIEQSPTWQILRPLSLFIIYQENGLKCKIHAIKHVLYRNNPYICAVKHKEKD